MKDSSNILSHWYLCQEKIMKLPVICFMNTVHLDSRVWSINTAAGHNHIIWHHMNKLVATNSSNLFFIFVARPDNTPEWPVHSSLLTASLRQNPGGWGHTPNLVWCQYNWWGSTEAQCLYQACHSSLGGLVGGWRGQSTPQQGTQRPLHPVSSRFVSQRHYPTALVSFSCNFIFCHTCHTPADISNNNNKRNSRTTK